MKQDQLIEAILAVQKYMHIDTCRGNNKQVIYGEAFHFIFIQ